MRFSLGSVGDLDVTPGATLAECRDAVDALLGPSAGADLTIKGHVLTPQQVAGVPPWLPGSHVDVGPVGPVSAGPATDPATAAGAPWHLAVVAGPDAGEVAAPGPDGRLLLGRGHGPEAAWRLALTDPAVSRGHAVLLTRGRGVVVRDAGSANRTWRRHPRRSRRWSPLRWLVGHPGHRWRRVRWAARLTPGDRLRIGHCELELRRHVTAPSAGTHADDGPAARAHRPEPGARAGRVASAVVPLVLGATMAALTRSPVFFLMAAAGPIVAAVPTVAARAARRRTAAPHADLGPDAAGLAVLLASGTPIPPAWWPLAREGLVVCGDDDALAAAGRALVGGALLDPAVALTLLHDPGRAGEWGWARWLASRLGGGEEARVPASGPAALRPCGDRQLVVADGRGPWRADVDRWWLAGLTGLTAGADQADRTDRAAIVLVRTGDPRPAWCRWLLVIGREGRARLTGPGVAQDVTAPAASAAWAEAHARRVAARDALLTEAGRELPVRVGPGDVGLPGDVEEVLAAWGGTECGRRALPGLRTPIGLAAGPRGVEPAWLDLRTDGPHALVAGTTGAGKSEMLQALVLGLALRHPPSELALVLLDFKGGAGLRACADLPHVVGHVSDLDPDQAVRALEGLTAELRRREALLAAAGVSDVESLRGPAARPRGRTDGAGLADATAADTRPSAPPRLLVVVDEFRALAEDLPDFVPGLVRLAAQGRSLGMHLVLATQRPAGAVTAQMRANLGLRICLRVTEQAESHDVVDVPDAAALPSQAPGRAVVRRADGAPQEVQTTWVALPAGSAAPVRRARPWEAFGRPWRAAEAVTPGRAEALTELAVRAAGLLAGAPALPAPVWSAPLPAVVGPRELADALGRPGADVPGGDLLLGLTDPAGAGPRGVLTWDGRGLLLVAGAAGSGRTTAAARAAMAALATGRHVHAIGPVARLLPAAHPGLGTTVDATDPRRLARLLALLATAGGPPAGAHGAAAGPLLLVDDVATVVSALDRMPRALGADLLESLAREAGRRGVGLLVTGHPRDVVRLAPLATARLVLPVSDTGDDGLLGVPRELSGRRIPGRGAFVAGGAAVRCHVALPSPTASRPSSDTGPVRLPVRLLPIPERVTWEALRTSPGPAGTACTAVATAGRPPTAVPGARSTSRWTALVGVGGDDAGPVALDARAGVLVVGPPGSGRSTALAMLVLALAGTGVRLGVVAREGPLATAAHAVGIGCAGTPAAAAALMESAGPGPLGIEALVVDDLDAMARSSSDLDDRLAAWVNATERGDDAPVLLAACRTDRAASAYRGAIAALRGAAPVLVLGPGEAGAAEVAGTDLTAVCDPALPRHPGRGAVVVHARATPVQVACPT